MEKKETAVEWLVEQMKLDELFNADYFIEQAKAMEKDQIIEAYREGYAGYSPTDYYHEIYGK